MKTYVLTHDAKVTELLDLYPNDAEQLAACKRMFVQFDATDLLPMLGVTA
jgi:hypothetical protein